MSSYTAASWSAQGIQPEFIYAGDMIAGNKTSNPRGADDVVGAPLWGWVGWTGDRPRGGWVERETSVAPMPPHEY